MRRFATLLTAATFAAAMALPCASFAQTGSAGVAGNSGAAGGAANAGVNASGNPSGPGMNGSVTGPGSGDAYKSGPVYGSRSPADSKNTVGNPAYNPNANGMTSTDRMGGSAGKTGTGY